MACGGDGGTEPEPVTVTISPASVTLGAAGTQTFTASVQGDAGGSVDWSASEGTVEVTGSSALYTAPVQGGSYTVTATATADPSARAQATVTVTPVEVAVTPASADVLRGERVALTASVEGVGSDATGVSWEASCGSIEGEGTEVEFVAPTDPGPCQVTATSVLDPGASASATVTVRSVLVVTTTEDTDDGVCDTAHCTLREALDAALATPDPDTIQFQAAGASAPGAGAALEGEILLTAPLPTLTGPVVLQGPGVDLLRVDAATNTASPRRVLTVEGADVVVSGIALRDGIADEGGGVLVRAGGTLELTQARISGSLATEGDGGGLLVTGSGSLARLVEVSFQSNRAAGAGAGGAGIAATGGGTIEMTGGQILDGSAADGDGGGALSRTGTLRLEDVVLARNEAEGTGGGGGIAVFGTVEVVLTDVELLDNVAVRGGGLLVSGTEAEITGGEISRNESAGEGGGLVLADGAGVDLREVELQENLAGTRGGGVALGDGDLLRTFTAVLSENVAVGDGGAVSSVGTGRIQFRNSAFTANEAGGDGGAAHLPGQSFFMENVTMTENVAGGSGGAVALAGSGSLQGSTFALNSAGGAGGGILASADAFLFAENTTVSGNEADVGGGIASAGETDLVNVTVVGNSAISSGAGLASTGGRLRPAMTLLTGNTVGDVPGGCAVSGTGTLVSNNYNLTDDPTCSPIFQSTRDLPDTDPMVDPELGDNGGPTPTHVLFDGSPAIDAGNPGLCTDTDQRGLPRVGPCDIGAVEYQPPGEE
jgi:CSLREA domain-containing protein